MGVVDVDVTGAVEGVRRFNRFWTRQIGVLQAGLLDTSYSLTEARVIFELAQAPATDLAELRARLGLDAGYLSRIVSRLRSEDLARTETSERDARRQVVRLTRRGRSVFKDLDRRSAEQVVRLLDALDDDARQRLLDAMATIETIVSSKAPAPRAYVLRPPRPGDFGWVVHRHGVLYHREYGWDQTFEALVAEVVAGYVAHHDPAREAAWIAELDGRPVGSVLCCAKDPETAQLRLLLVEPSARGLGVGSRLVEECIRFARDAGYQRMVLWTNDVLVAARRIYEGAGFVLVEREEHHSFGHDLVGETWALELCDPPIPPR